MGSMKVGVIAGEMEGRSTGVGRYLKGLFTGLEQWDHGIEWHLFFQGDQFELPAAVTQTAKLHFTGHHGSRVVWEQFLVSRQMAPFDLDLVFGPANTLPFGCRAPAVVTIHDLSFEVLPGEFGPRERWRRRLLARRAARVARRVFAVSQPMAGLISRQYHLNEGAVVVVPNGVDSKRFSAEPDPGDNEILSSLGVRPPYILWMGTVLERRLPQPVLEAFAALRRDFPDLQLVFAGANRMRRPENLGRWVQSLALGDAVKELGWVEEANLSPLYRGAEIGIYLSFHEGFGIPPLECLACGTPVVVSEGLALDEAWPDYPYRCAGRTAADIEIMARSALLDPMQSAEVAAAAQGVVADFGWEAASRRLVAEMKSAVSL